MENIEQIIKNSALKDKKWEKILKQCNEELHFLSILTPIMEYLFLELADQLKNKYPKLLSFVKKTLLIEHIFENFVNHVNPMIIRLCILEMHYLSQKNILKGNTSEERFTYFIQLLSNPSNLLDFLNKYSVVKEQIVIFSKQFLTVNLELFARLDQDHEEVFSMLLNFRVDIEKLELISIETSGDRHQEGHGVMILVFNYLGKETKLVYKPRSLAIDIAFQQFIEWFNHVNEVSELYTFKIIDKNNYGWCEYVEYAFCQNLKEIELFYFRLGVLLMILYLLGGYDMHAENLVAHGSFPVIVDYECLLPPLYSLDGNFDQDNSRSLVSKTLFLPMDFKITEEGGGFDLSAIGASGGEKVDTKIINWIDIGKDTMRAIRGEEKVPSFLNKPKTFRKKQIDFLNYEKNIIKGFQQAYRFFLKNRNLLLKRNSTPLNLFKNKRVRIVFRDTEAYMRLLYEKWHPQFVHWKEGNNQYHSWVKTVLEEIPSMKTLFPFELQDLEQGNVPIFTCLTTEKKIVDSNNVPINILVKQSGYETIFENIKKYLNEKDLKEQIGIIKTSFEQAREKNF